MEHWPEDAFSGAVALESGLRWSGGNEVRFTLRSLPNGGAEAFGAFFEDSSGRIWTGADGGLDGM